MKVACVLITHLRAKVEMRRRPGLKDRPAVIVGRCRGRPAVVDCFPAAGVAVGMTPEQALSRQPDGILLEADEAAYRREFRRMLASLQGVSDRVEEAELGVAYVGLDGLEAMYGGEARLATAMLNAVPQDLTPRLGVGDAKFPAYVAARSARGAQLGDTGGLAGVIGAGGILLHQYQSVRIWSSTVFMPAGWKLALTIWLISVHESIRISYQEGTDPRIFARCPVLGNVSANPLWLALH